MSANSKSQGNNARPSIGDVAISIGGIALAAALAGAAITVAALSAFGQLIR